MTSEFPAQRVYNAENASIWWSHLDVNMRTLVRVKWPVACCLTSRYLSQWWRIVCWNHRNKLRWSMDQSTFIFSQQGAFENTVWRPFCKCSDISTKIRDTHEACVDWLDLMTLIMSWLVSFLSDLLLKIHFDGLVQDCSISIANTLEIRQYCTKPSNKKGNSVCRDTSGKLQRRFS